MKSLCAAALVPAIFLVCCLPSCASMNVEGMQGFSLRGGVGPAVWSPSTEDDSRFTGNVDEEDIAWGVGIGYRPHRRLALEIGYEDLGEIEYDGLWLGAPSRGTVENTGVSLAAVGYWPVHDKLDLVGRLGLLRWEQKEVEVGVGTYTDKGTDAFVGIGVEGRLAEHFGARLTWNHYFEIADDHMYTVMLDFLFHF